jgi:hypothetical protein
MKMDRYFHVFIPKINDPMFFRFFGLISDFCWRRISLKQIQRNVCFCNVMNFNAIQTIHDTTSVDHIIKFLNVSHIHPLNEKIAVGLISRRRKRFILNEYELIDTLADMGYDARLLPLETMTLYEQMLELRSLHILVGIHGSGLDNSVFLHPGSVLVQLFAYKLNHAITFPETARRAGVRYLDWHLEDVNKTIFHWDLFRDADAEKLARSNRQDLIAGGSAVAGSRELAMFWINQVCPWLLRV